MRKQVQLYDLQQSQKHLAQRFDGPILRQSNFSLLLWKVLQLRKTQDIQTHYQAIVEAFKDRIDDSRHKGPIAQYENEAELFKDLAQKWGKASEMIHRLCMDRRIQYLHFLQPNQYVEGSKPMGEEERSQADIHFKQNTAKATNRSAVSYSQAVVLGYPHLQKAGGMLSKKGISFYDLTLLYKEEERAVYHDYCCHFNALGLEIMAEEVAQKILQD